MSEWFLLTTLNCQSVTKMYGRHTILDGIDFQLNTGSVTGLAGPNGSGKTTLMKILSGLSMPTSGSVRLEGMAPNRVDPSQNSVGVFLGVQNLHPGRTVLETLRLAVFLAELPDSRADDRLRWSGLEAVKKRRVKGLSLGMKVRLGMALATIRDAHILLLDEPMNGLDLEAIHWVKFVVRQHAERGGSCLVSSHLLNELEAIADRALILSRGTLVRDERLDGDHRRGEASCIRVGDDHRFAQALSSTGWAHRRNGDLWTISADLEEVARFAFESSTYVRELRPARGASLEELFIASAQGEFAPRVEAGSL